MTEILDLHQAADRMIRLVDAVPDDALDAPTPCDAYTVGDLLDHIGGAALAFTAAAAKAPLAGGPSGDASRLGPAWRSRIARDLAALADAWREPAAWSGTTQAGGVDLPAELAGVVALDELVIHGWDLAVAIGAPTADDGPGLDAVHRTVQHFRAAGIPGLYGPVVPVADDADLLHRILGLAGRDPGWVAPAAVEGARTRSASLPG